MALHIKTKYGAGHLWDGLKGKLEKGEIDTWMMDSDGDFTHRPVQWVKRAWFRKSKASSANELVFGLIGREDENMSKGIYAVYHGRFAEMLLTYFDEEIETVEISSLAEVDVDFFR